MPITRKALGERRSRLVLDFPDTADTLTVYYRPEAFTPRRQRELVAEAVERVKQPESALGVQQEVDLLFLLDVLAAWDLLVDEQSEKTVPITRAALEDLGYETLGRLALGILGAMRPNPLTGASSANGSAPAGGAAPPRTGSFS